MLPRRWSFKGFEDWQGSVILVTSRAKQNNALYWLSGRRLSFCLHNKSKTTDLPELQCSHRLLPRVVPFFPIFFLNNYSFFPQNVIPFSSFHINKNDFPNSCFCFILLYYFIEDRPFPLVIEPLPEREYHSYQPPAHFPTLLIPAVRKARHSSGHKRGLAWESMKLRDKRGNAADNSRSCTVHKLSTSGHTHWWNLVPAKHTVLLARQLTVDRKRSRL